MGGEHALSAFLAEHGEILDVLDRLSEVVDFEHPTAGRVARVLGCLAALRDFRPHHRREENMLFPILRQAGFASIADLMQGEHALLQDLEGSARTIAHGILFESRDAQDEWGRMCRGTSSLLTLQRVHLRKETEVLYPHVLAAATPNEWERLALQEFHSRPRDPPCGPH